MQPDMDYVSGANKKCLDAAIAKYKDADPYDLSDLSHDSAWEEANMRIKDDPQKTSSQSLILPVPEMPLKRWLTI